MLFLRDAICEQIPHLGIAVVKVLLHPQGRLSGLVFAMAHGSELGEAFGSGPITVGAGVSRLSLSFASATLSDDFGFYKRLASCTVADVRVISLDKSFGQGVQAVEVVAGVCDALGLKSQPLDHLFNCNELLSLLALRIGVVET